MSSKARWILRKKWRGFLSPEKRWMPFFCFPLGKYREGESSSWFFLARRSMVYDCECLWFGSLSVSNLWPSVGGMNALYASKRFAGKKTLWWTWYCAMSVNFWGRWFWFPLTKCLFPHFSSILELDLNLRWWVFLYVGGCVDRVSVQQLKTWSRFPILSALKSRPRTLSSFRCWTFLRQMSIFLFLHPGESWSPLERGKKRTRISIRLAERGDRWVNATAIQALKTRWLARFPNLNAKILLGSLNRGV